MFYASRGNLPGMAIFLDFRKAFDTIEWLYLEKLLTHFNFGPNFLQWFKTLPADISSCVLNNGHASRLFPINRGVRQGCPLSCLLFVIGLELLARSIRRDNLIKGIIIGRRNNSIYVYRRGYCFCTRPRLNNAFTKYAREIWFYFRFTNQHVKN